MPRALKVYGTHTYPGWASRAGARGVVATTSQTKAAEALGMTLGEFRHSGCETGNANEVRLALCRPGVVVWFPGRHSEPGLALVRVTE